MFTGRRVSSSSNKSPQVSRTNRSKPTTVAGVQSSKKSSNSVNMAQYSDPTSYLIDKMFEGDSNVSIASSCNGKEASPEQNMYKEAASHDKSFRQKEMATAELQSQSKKTNNTTTLAKPGKNIVYAGALSSSSNKKGLGKSSSHQTNSSDDLQIVENLPPSEDKEDREDKASEAGTYTIEIDEEEQDEVEAARRRIDEVFGVLDDISNDSSVRPIMSDLRLASPGGYDNVTDDLDGDKTPQEAHSFNPMDDLILKDDDDLNDDGEDNERDQEEEEYDEDEEVSFSKLGLYIYLYHCYRLKGANSAVFVVYKYNSPIIHIFSLFLLSPFDMAHLVLKILDSNLNKQGQYNICTFY